MQKQKEKADPPEPTVSTSATQDRTRRVKTNRARLRFLRIRCFPGHHQEGSVNVGRDGLLVESDVIGVLDSHVAHVIGA